jgi:hypothetical protein
METQSKNGGFSLKAVGSKSRRPALALNRVALCSDYFFPRQ